MNCLLISRVQSYRDLVAWQKSVELVVETYPYTQNFPRTETYGLVSQLRRAAVSIPSNIAEGHARLSTGEFGHFLAQAPGSLVELETQVLIAERLGYMAALQSAALFKRTTEIGRVINGLLSSLSH